MNINIVTAKNKGHRQYMEDYAFHYDLPAYTISGILDGHGGKAAAEFVCKWFHPLFKEYMTKYSQNVRLSLHATIINLHQFIISSKFTGSGTTCNVVVICKRKFILYACNVGDSRAIAGYLNNQVRQLTVDHSPTLPLEKELIYSKGGFIQNNRVQGILSLSRAIGDLDIAQYLSPVPDIFQYSLAGIKFILQSSDGLLDVMTNIEIFEKVTDNMKQRNAPRTIVQNLINYALNEKKATDNLAVNLITFY